MSDLVTRLRAEIDEDVNRGQHRTCWVACANGDAQSARNRHQTRSMKRLNRRLGADMRAITIIILAIASGLAYAGLIEGIVKFATLIP